MKKLLVLLNCLLLVFILSSCGPAVPQKEMEDAKTSIEKARTVDAQVYAPQIYSDAEKDYNEASNYIITKKNKEAKEKAISSKDKADQSYDTAREARANDVYKKCSDLMDKAAKNLADKIYPDIYNDVKTNFDAMKSSIDSKDFDSAYNNGVNLQPKIQKLSDDSAARIEEAKNAIAKAQDKYDQAESNDLVKEYALADLKKAIPVLDDAKKLVEAGNIDGSLTNSAEAVAIVDGAVSAANDRYQKYLEQKKAEEEAAALEKQKELDAQKQKAEKYIDEAKRKLEELKSHKKTSMLDIKFMKFSFIRHDFILISEDMDETSNTENNNDSQAENSQAVTDTGEEMINDTDINTDSVNNSGDDQEQISNLSDQPDEPATADQNSNEENVQTNTNINYTIDSVESNIGLAEESYKNEEYLDAIDYAREAIRIADILLAMQEEEEKALALAQSNSMVTQTNIVVETNVVQPPAVTNVQPVQEEEFKIYVVKLNKKNRDCLWKISGYMYNKRYWLWPVIWKANKYQIKDPDLIYPGQELKIPTAPLKKKK